MQNIQTSEQATNEQESVVNFVKRQFKEHYNRILDLNTVADWDDDLKGFSFFNIHRAFSEFRRSGTKYPPKSFDIRKLIVSSFAEKKKNTGEITFRQQCYFVGCSNNADERVGDNAWMCSQHSNENYKFRFPDSTTAKVLKLSKEFEGDAKDLGISNEEYFKKTEPKIWAMIFRNRENETARVGMAQKVLGRMNLSAHDV